MKAGLYQVILLAVACCVKISEANHDTVYDFSNSSMTTALQIGSTVKFMCQVKDSETALLKIANETLAEAKHDVSKRVVIERKHNGKMAACIAKDSNGKTVQETRRHLDVWFPPVPANHSMRHHYKLMVGHAGHIIIHFLTNPAIDKYTGQVKMIGPTGQHIHNFHVAHVIHQHRTTDHFIILTFHEAKQSDFGNYTVIVTSVHFQDKPMIQHFTIADITAEAAAKQSSGGIVAAIVIGSLLTIGLIALMVFFIMRTHKQQALPEARRPIVTEEGGPGIEDGLIDDVFAENRPGSSRIESINNSRM